METTSKHAAFVQRFFIYQKERFPFLGHGLLVASFSFSAISYSRICRGANDFVNPKIFVIGIITTVTLFFLVRVFDEFKDAEDDAMYRKHLPVPRGLISLRELGACGAVAFIIQVALNATFFPKMLLLYGLVIGYLCLMGKEFFAGRWLKKHPFWYVTSHMMIIPLIDMYASGLDWMLADVEAPRGLMFFFAVSFMNGIVLEIGRKIRIPEKEEFNTYSTMLGSRKATWLWLTMLFLTACFAFLASWFANYGLAGFMILTGLLLVCSLPGLLFLQRPTENRSKWIEYASAVWTAGMYLTLGGVPMFFNLIHL